MVRRAWLLFLAMCLLWGVPYLFIKVAVVQVSPVWMVFGRTGVAVLVLLPVALRRGVLRGKLPAVVALALMGWPTRPCSSRSKSSESPRR